MVIIETSVFTHRVQTLLPEESYRKLQLALLRNPEIGVVIPSSGGLRKVRWEASGRGKRGGARIIYYWATQQGQIMMLFIFAKNESDDLSQEQLKVLRKIIEEEYP